MPSRLEQVRTESGLGCACRHTIVHAWRRCDTWRVASPLILRSTLWPMVKAGMVLRGKIHIATLAIPSVVGDVMAGTGHPKVGLVCPLTNKEHLNGAPLNGGSPPTSAVQQAVNLRACLWDKRCRWDSSYRLITNNRMNQTAGRSSSRLGYRLDTAVVVSSNLIRPTILLLHNGRLKVNFHNSPCRLYCDQTTSGVLLYVITNYILILRATICCYFHRTL